MSRELLTKAREAMKREEPFLAELFKDDEIDALARAVLRLLADPANISDEMVEAAQNANDAPLTLDDEPMRRALAAAFAKERADNLTGERKPDPRASK